MRVRMTTVNLSTTDSTVERTVTSTVNRTGTIKSASELITRLNKMQNRNLHHSCKSRERTIHNSLICETFDDINDDEFQSEKSDDQYGEH